MIDNVVSEAAVREASVVLDGRMYQHDNGDGSLRTVILAGGKAVEDFRVWEDKDGVHQLDTHYLMSYKGKRINGTVLRAGDKFDVPRYVRYNTDTRDVEIVVKPPRTRSAGEPETDADDKE